MSWIGCSFFLLFVQYFDAVTQRSADDFLGNCVAKCASVCLLLEIVHRTCNWATGTHKNKRAHLLVGKGETLFCLSDYQKTTAETRKWTGLQIQWGLRHDFRLTANIPVQSGADRKQLMTSYPALNHSRDIRHQVAGYGSYNGFFRDNFGETNNGISSLGSFLS